MATRPGARTIVFNVILGLDLVLVAYAFTIALVDAARVAFGGQSILPSEATAPTNLWSVNAQLLLLFGIVPLVWGLGTRCAPVRGTILFFRLHDPWKGMLRGLAWGLALLGGLIVLGNVLHAFGYNPPNPQADALVSQMTWPLAFVTAAVAGLGEEILFRGFLQRKVGYWAQAVLFGLAHAGYGTVLQLLIPFALGLGFGWLIRRGYPLWTVIVAHFLFDFVQLSSGLWLPWVEHAAAT